MMMHLAGTPPIAGAHHYVGEAHPAGGIPLEAKYERTKELLYQQAAEVSRVEAEMATARQRQLDAEQAFLLVEHRVGHPIKPQPAHHVRKQACLSDQYMPK